MKTERVRRKIYGHREAARRDIFDYIERFYNPVRRHGNNGGPSSVEIENRFLYSWQAPIKSKTCQWVTWRLSLLLGYLLPPRPR
ncbi:IS3 family transposase [Marinobacter daqiaonensis]|uniref:IS3 family transposase n=1 Tax=Marinobacter daqiaonensis TaxID=650891 RepID=UPI0011144DD7